jgi:hypothetical protein
MSNTQRGLTRKANRQRRLAIEHGAAEYDSAPRRALCDCADVPDMWFHDGRMMLNRCPVCERYNNVHFIGLGSCAWCGWNDPIRNAIAELDLQVLAQENRTDGLTEKPCAARNAKL